MAIASSKATITIGINVAVVAWVHFVELAIITKVTNSIVIRIIIVKVGVGISFHFGASLAWAYQPMGHLVSIGDYPSLMEGIAFASWFEEIHLKAILRIFLVQTFSN